VNALLSPEHNKEAVLAAIHSSAGPLCTRVGHWRRRPPGYLAVFSTFARLRPFCAVLDGMCRGARTSRAIPENYADFCAHMMRMTRGLYLRTAACYLRTFGPT
jgi:hypothetical protein